MRSGQYKISGSGLKGSVGNDSAVAGQFRSSSTEVPISDSPIPEFPHMNSLVVTMNKMTESRPLNKSCENLSGPRGAVNRVEQRVKSFLQRGEARLRQGEDSNSPIPSEDGWQYGHVVTLPRRPRLSLALSHSALNHLSTSDTASCLSASSGYSSSSSSSYGSFKSNCSTLPRKQRSCEEQHISPSTSRSCTFVDNPMYDITPGTDPRSYQVTSSLKRRGSPSPRHDSIYDFTPATDPRNYNLKSHRRRSASVPRHEPIYDVTPDMDLQHFDHNKSSARRGSVPVNQHIYDVTPDSDPLHCNYSDSPCHQSSPNLRNDPIYDTIPGSDSYSPYRQSPTQGHDHLYDVARPSRLLTPDSGTHGGLDSLEESALDSLDCSDPQTAISENDEAKEDQVAKECREYFEKRLKNSETLKKRWSLSSSDSGADSGDSEMSPLCSSSASAVGLSNVTTSSTASTAKGTSGGLLSSKEPIETDPFKKTPLDQKMEFLRKEIASLMKQDNQLFKQLLNLHESISALKTNPPHPLRPPSPASLDSFTEEEEEEEDEEEEDEDEDEGEKEDIERQKRMEKEATLEDNLSDVDEGLETDHSLTHSISPTSTLSSKSSRDSTLSSKSCRDSTLSSKSSRDSHFSKDSHSSAAEATSPESSPVQSSRPPPSPFQRAVSSPSPQSSKCCQSSAFNGNSGTLAFMRSRKSYAPNARNRRRSSSAHLLVRPDLETFTTRHESQHELHFSAVEVSFSSDEVSEPCIAGGNIPQMTSNFRESSPAQRSFSLLNSARESVSGKTIDQGTNSLGSGGREVSSSSSSSSATRRSEQQQHPRRPRSSSAILSAAMYPSVPSSRPLNYPVFREALIM